MARFRLCAQSAADVGEDVVDLAADNGKDDDDHDGDEDEDKRLLHDAVTPLTEAGGATADKAETVGRSADDWARCVPYHDAAAVGRTR
jgi:hypothetical protein